MHHVLGRVAGVLAIPMWTFVTIGVGVNFTHPTRVFQTETIVVLAILGATFVVAWFTNLTVTLTVKEREDIYLAGVRDAMRAAETPDPNVKSFGQRRTM